MQTRCHLSVLIHEQAKKYGDREVLFFQALAVRNGNRSHGTNFL